LRLFAASFLALIAACQDPVGTTDRSPATDDEFDSGSFVADQTPTPIQIENLTLLGKVWGFAKYHHPRVVGGGHHWDYELFRAIPSVLAASGRMAAAAAMVAWLDGLGSIQECSSCVQPPSQAHLEPEIGWIDDVAQLGAELSGRLQTMHRNRPASGAHRYVSFQQHVGNPDFSQEARYTGHAAPDAGYRLLALFRFWNIIQYWFPYRDVMDEDWDAVLTEFIPVVMGPMDGDEYRLAMIRLTGRVHDTHANLWRELHLRPPVGDEEVPVLLRFVEGKPVVFGYSHDQLGPATGLQVGDEIHRIDGVAVETLIDSLTPYYPASNQAARLRDLARYLTRGSGPAAVGGVGEDGAFELSAPRAPRSSLDRGRSYRHDLPGPTFQMLSDSVAYLKLSSVVAASAGDYIRQAQSAGVLVIDIRNYPSEFVVFALGGHLVAGSEAFARFTKADRVNPGAFLWTEPVAHSPAEPRFTGKVVILVDEVTQSQAEYTTMAFRVAPQAIVVGSTTAGADGNVSPIPLPGNVESMISGIGVFYPDRTPTQRIGIVPDLVVLPTVEGIRAGRDEVLEAGVSHALGRDFRLQPTARPSARRAPVSRAGG
jgi:C-terminal processing protease CtpA/Prc